MKRKALAVFMTTAVVISSMAGCGVSTGSSNSKEEETTEAVSDDTSAFDDFISDEFIMESSVDEGNQRAMGSINSLLSRMNNYDKDRFNSLYNDGIPNIVCK